MAAEANKQAEANKMVVIGCCSTGSASGGHQAGTPPLLEPALQQSIKTILFVSAYLSASAASLVQGRWIYHKSTGPIGAWMTRRHLRRSMAWAAVSRRLCIAFLWPQQGVGWGFLH